MVVALARLATVIRSGRFAARDMTRDAEAEARAFAHTLSLNLNQP